LLASRKKDYPQALTHFENALREQPDVPYIQGYVGRTLTEIGRYAEAREVLAAVARDKRVRSTELYNLAVAERKLRNNAAVISALKRALEIDKSYFRASALLAKTEYELGHWLSAWFYFRQAVKQCSSQETLQMMTENK
jgi:tetratricopeptide (TPR) repeat protein